MRKKNYSIRILPLFIIFTMLFSYIPVSALENDVVNKKNLALNKNVKSSGYEAGSNLTADKITDGVIDNTGEKPGSSRWASERYAVNPWITIDLGENKIFDEVVIQWERKNVNSYKIEVSEDNSIWKVVHSSSTVNEYRESLSLGEQNSRYIKITIEDYSPAEADSNISWETVSIYEVYVYNNNVNPEPELDVVVPQSGQNVSLNKTASASSEETNTFTANKVIDGIVDRKPEGQAVSRWASAVSSDDQWLKIDLGKKTQFENVVIEWERKNSTRYRVQISDNDVEWTDIYTANAEPVKHRDVINLTEKVAARYVRLYIDEHQANSEGVNWNTVSVFEMEIYNGGVPQGQQTAQEVANNLQVRELTTDDTTLQMPIVPEGFEISLIGADYEEVIDYEMNIHKPLVNTTVEVNFEVKKGSQKATSPAIKVVVPGKYEVTGNTKPTVIPELREWYGKSGNFTIEDSSRIVIDSASETNLMEAMKTFAEDYKNIVGNNIEVVVSSTPNRGDLYFAITNNYPELREEGYYMDIDNIVKIEANSPQGAFLATRSILQILKQNGTTIPKGLVRDYPKYDVRGFMLDVGRKFHSLEYLYEVVKTMSWYKMNDFQVHLNDNYIWLERDYGENAIDAYAGFRLESNDVGENGKKLTSEDGHYSKTEFGKFIDDSKTYGVNIVPEIDSPGHALSFIKVHPEFAYRGNTHGENAAMLDVTKPEVVEYIKGIFSEYTDGENPVFRNATVHVGTDEFYGNAEQYRAYTDEMLRYIRDEKGRKPRFWGSLSNKGGSTPVISQDVEMNIWNVGWANPQAMYNQGYDLINTDDAYGYIVPGANYYKNYLDIKWLYENWKANKFSNGTVIPAGSPQMIGGMFALWNDLIDVSANGIVEYDNFDRIYPAIQVMGEKMWGEGIDKTYNEFKEVANRVGLAPNTNPRYEVPSISEVVIDYDFKDSNNNIVNDKSGNGYNSISSSNANITNGTLKLAVGESYIETPVDNLGQTYSVAFSVKRANDSNNEEQVLFESSKGQFKAVQKSTGKVGFSREGYDYSFNYELPKSKWVDITIIGKLNKTELYVNGDYVDEISKNSSTGKFGTFIFPLEKIGSLTNSFNGEIKLLKVSNVATIYDETKIPQEQMTATATSEHPNIGSEGLDDFAIDGNESTFWHTNWTNPVQLPQSVTIELGGTYTIDKFTYLPRQSGSNGNITSYEIQVSTNGTDFCKVSEGKWENNASLKTVRFDNQVEATHVRLIAKAGVGGFASAAELNVHKVKEQTPDPEPLEEIGFKITVGREEITVGDNFDIKIATKDLTADNMYAMEFNVAYDNDKVNFVGATSLNNDKYIVSSKNKDGSVDVIVATKGVAIENDIDIVNLEFTANVAGENIPVNISKGRIADDSGNMLNMIDATTTVNIGEEIVNPNPDVDKNALKIAIDYADEIVANDSLEGIVQAVVKEFNEALVEAKEVYQDVDATETDVDNSFKRLVNVIWMLEYKQGNKETLQVILDAAKALVEKEYTAESWAKLQEVINEAEKVLADENAMQPEIDETINSLNNVIARLVKRNVDKTELQNFINKVEGLKKDEYIESTWSKFEEVLNLAKGILVNEDVTQDEVDLAYNTLVKAYIELRLKPDKSKLEDLINKVKDMDLSKFTSESVAVLNKELEKATSIFNNKEATQEDINMATRVLNIALANLEEKSGDSNGNKPEDGNKPNSGGNSNNPKPGIKLPNTGAAVSSGIILLLGATIAFAGVATLKKRK